MDTRVRHRLDLGASALAGLLSTDAYGATLTPLDDNSLLASGGRSDIASYTVMA